MRTLIKAMHIQRNNRQFYELGIIIAGQLRYWQLNVKYLLSYLPKSRDVRTAHLPSSGL